MAAVHHFELPKFILCHCNLYLASLSKISLKWDNRLPSYGQTRSTLGRAHVPPTKVFRRLSRHSRVDCKSVTPFSPYREDILLISA